MLKKVVTFAASLLVSTQMMAAPTVYPTGVTIYNPQKAWNQYTIFSAADQKSYLIDMNGNVVQSWPYKGFPTEVIDPEVNKGKKGHVFVQLEERRDPNRPSLGNGVNNYAVAELDWNGKIVWSWAGENNKGAHQHHEISRLSNGNTLILANKIHAIPGFKLSEIIDDAIYEVDAKGKIVWSWLASEHLNEFGFTPEQLELVRNTDHADYLHFNNARILGANKWFDAGDARFHPDNIIVDSRQANFIAIIEKKTGKVVWNLGPNYSESPNGSNPFLGGNGKLPRPVDQLSGQHDAKIIAKGLPGAGNILVFDNHSDAGYPDTTLKSIGRSRILEIDPSTKQIVWEYSPGASLFSSRTSLARRLPNGNTQITEGQTGRVFQITSQGEIVWEYINPYFSEATGQRPASNNLYRATPVPYDWAPQGTPRSEIAVVPPKLEDFHIQPTH